jgi:Cytochrome c oxidase assembly protein CtaG/Cox11
VTFFNLGRIVPTQAVLVFAAAVQLFAAERIVDMSDPTQVIQAYLRATYARDYVEAYRLISTQDRKVRDLNRYVQYRGAFSGFILHAAKKVSEAIEIQLLEQKKIGDSLLLVVKYRVPDAKKIAPILLNWDSYRLNSLSAADRDQLLSALDSKRRDGSLEMIDGEVRFELVREGNEWRVFLNWAAGVKVPLRLDLSKAAGLEVSLSEREVAVLPGEIFRILLKVKNKTNQAITARIGHLVEPKDSADYLDFVQCGFLLPVTIPPAMEQEYSSVYLLRGNLPEEVRQLELKYDFDILK